MSVRRCVALLRGINVGGQNVIPMAELKACFEDAGLTGVSTYIQSGNVLFNHPGGDQERLRARLEQALLERFNCSSRAHLLSGRDLRAVVKGAPASFGREPAAYRYDALFLMKPLTAAAALAELKVKEGVDRAWAGEGVIYFSRLIAKAAQSRLSRLTQMPIYRHMTVRNWNTTTKLLALMTACAALLLAAPSARAEAWRPPAGLAQAPIWPGPAPDAPPAAEPESLSKAENLVAGREWRWVTNVSTPTMTVFPAKGANAGAAVIVFPGGGFMGLAIDLEGTEVCDWLTAKGVTCVLLKYRVPRSEDYYDQKLGRHVEPKTPAAFQDAQRTIRLVRSRAAEWGVDPRKIGVLGFSAGGYLAAKTATEFEERSYAPVNAADRESARPDFSVPVYPGHLWKPREGSAELRLSPRIHPSSRVPPTFLLQAEDDHVDGVEQTLTYYRALQKAGASVEMHLYARGGHAFGLRRTDAPITDWPRLVETWLGTIGVLAKP